MVLIGLRKGSEYAQDLEKINPIVHHRGRTDRNFSLVLALIVLVNWIV